MNKGVMGNNKQESSSSNSSKMSAGQQQTTLAPDETRSTNATKGKDGYRLKDSSTHHIKPGLAVDDTGNEDRVCGSQRDDEFDHARRANALDKSIDEIEEESEGVDTSESIVMLVQDFRERADERKIEFSNRCLMIQNRLQDLEELRIRKELSKLNIH